MDELATLGSIASPEERAVAISRAIDEHQAHGLKLATLRRAALEDWLNEGATQAVIAKALGISRARVSAMLSQGLRPERTFFGSETVTLAVAGKAEAGRADDKTNVVVSSPAMAAVNELTEALQGLGLTVATEVVPPPGFVDLNRPGLVIIGGTRLLPMVGQLMHSDPRFRLADDGEWHYTDSETGGEFRSGKGVDYAYLGRLPRPDQQGTFLHIAGLHSESTLAATHYLIEQLPELNRTTRGRRFSQVLKCTNDQTTAATPIVKVDAA